MWLKILACHVIISQQVASDWWHVQIADLPVLLYRHVNAHVIYGLSWVNVEHVIIEAQSSLENLLVGQVKGHALLRAHFQSHSELIGFSKSVKKASMEVTTFVVRFPLTKFHTNYGIGYKRRSFMVVNE